MIAKAWGEASVYLNAQGYSNLYTQSYYPSLGKGVDGSAVQDA